MSGFSMIKPSLILFWASHVTCLPVPMFDYYEPTSTQYLEVLIASVFSALVLIFLILLCGSCFNRQDGHLPLQESGDLDLTSVVTSQPVQSSVYTIDEEVTFESLPDIERFKNKKEPKKFSGNLQLAAVPLVEVDKLSDWLSHPASSCQRQKLQYLKVLGGGWFGQAVEAEGRDLVESEGHLHCVVKILRPDATSQEMLKFLDEVKCYRDVRHTNILKLVGLCLESYPKLIVLQHCSNGDLKSYLLDQQKIGYIPTASALTKMSLDIANGLHCLHGKGFVHPDLAARNCLVTSKGSIVIGDYGISREVHKGDYYEIGGAVIPIRWVAPEDVFVSEENSSTVVAEYEASKAGNVWSLGVILWEIFELGNLPYSGFSNEEVIESVIISTRLVIDRPQRQPSGDALYQLMLQCCSADPLSRPTVENAIAVLSGLYALTMRSDIDFDTRWDQLQRQSSAFSDGASVDDSLFGMPDFEDSLKVHYSKAKESSDDDLVYTEKVNEALRTLDQALSAEEEELKPRFDLGLAVLSNPFGPSAFETQQLDSLTPSYFEVEERVERGEFEDLVREKSRSVTDLMRLTHVENGNESLNFSDKEPLLDKERSVFASEISPVKFVVNTTESIMENSNFYNTPIDSDGKMPKHTSTPHAPNGESSRKELFSAVNLTVPTQDPEIPDLLEISPDRRSQTLDLLVDAPVFALDSPNDPDCEKSFAPLKSEGGSCVIGCDLEEKLTKIHSPEVSSPDFEADFSNDESSCNRVVEIKYGAPIPILTPIQEESFSLTSDSSFRLVESEKAPAEPLVRKLEDTSASCQNSRNSLVETDDVVQNEIADPDEVVQNEGLIVEVLRSPPSVEEVVDNPMTPEHSHKEGRFKVTVLDKEQEVASLESSEYSDVAKEEGERLEVNSEDEGRMDSRPDSPESEDEYSENKDWISDVSSSDDECETAGDGSISTGAVFIWKEFHPVENEEMIAEEGEQETPKDDDPESFVPSTWDSTLTPTKSALKSPEHTLNSSDHKKSVSFRKTSRQKIYSYPPLEGEQKLEIVGSPTSGSPRRHWTQSHDKEEQLRQLAQLADWEYDEDGNERSSPDYEFTVVAGDMPSKHIRSRKNDFSNLYQISSLDNVGGGEDEEFYPPEAPTSLISTVGSTFNPKDFFPNWARNNTTAFVNGGTQKSFEIDIPAPASGDVDEIDAKTVNNPKVVICVDPNGNTDCAEISKPNKSENSQRDTENNSVASSNLDDEIGSSRYALGSLKLDFRHDDDDAVIDSDDSADITGFLS